MKEEALEVLTHRRSVRAYKDTPVPDELIERIVEAGMYAPTAINKMSPQIVVVKTPDYLARVKELNAGTENIQHDPYYGAPVVILVLHDPNILDRDNLGDLDAAAVCTNMLNAAYAVGLDTCWINRAQAMFKTEEGKQLLREWGLPENLNGVASIALGYRNCDYPDAKPRREGYAIYV